MLLNICKLETDSRKLSSIIGTVITSEMHTKDSFCKQLLSPLLLMDFAIFLFITIIWQVAEIVIITLETGLVSVDGSLKQRIRALLLERSCLLQAKLQLSWSDLSSLAVFLLPQTC